MIDRWSARFRTCMLAALLGMGVTVTPLAAQTVTADRMSVETLLADRLGTLAVLLLQQTEADDDRLTASRILFDMALELSPSDAELWRLRSEQAQLMGDAENHRRALREYCRLRPDDDAAAAELILLSLEQRQTLDERVAAVERLVSGSISDSLTPALRSRLASYVALAARETGNTNQFRSWLQYAIRTDPTNVVAARLIYERVMERNAPPLDLAVALHGLLRANPMDPLTHKRLGELFLTYGIYDEAAAQFEVAQRLSEEPGSASFYQSWALALAANGNTNDALEIIAAFESHLTHLAKESESEGETEASPRRSRLPVEMRMLRLCIQSGLEAPTGGSLQRIRETFEEQVRAGDSMAKLRLAWLLVWFNQDSPAAIALVHQLGEERGRDDAAVRRLRGWLALHAGEKDQAQDLLGGLADTDAFAAYGMARLYRDSDSGRSQRWLRRTVQIEPASLAGMMAARELAQAGQAPELTEVAVGLRQTVRSWRHMIVKPDPARRPWVGVEISVEPARPRYLDPVIAKISVRNLTDIPLAFGPDGAIPTRLFVYLNARHAGRPLGSLPPVVVEMNRRIRLEPNEAATVYVPLHRGHLGMLLRQFSAQNVSFSATAVLDPRTTAQGRIVHGLMGASATRNLVEVTGVSPTQATLERWLAALEQSDRMARARALSKMVQMVAPLAQNPETAEWAQRIVNGVNGVYPTADVATQAWTLLHLPPTDEDIPDYPFSRIMELAQRSDHPLVRISYIMSHVIDADSPQITAAMRHSDPRISVMARVQRQILIEHHEREAQRQEQAQP